MANIPVNATGWTELMDADMVGAVYKMFNTAFGSTGLIIVILFFTYQIMLYQKTKNITLTWVIGIIFASLYIGSAFVEPFASRIIFVLLVFQFAGILFMMFSK